MNRLTLSLEALGVAKWLQEEAVQITDCITAVSKIRPGDPEVPKLRSGRRQICREIECMGQKIASQFRSYVITDRSSTTWETTPFGLFLPRLENIQLIVVWLWTDVCLSLPTERQLTSHITMLQNLQTDIRLVLSPEQDIPY
jgi:hypothetical protein